MGRRLFAGEDDANPGVRRHGEQGAFVWFLDGHFLPAFGAMGHGLLQQAGFRLNRTASAQGACAEVVDRLVAVAVERDWAKAIRRASRQREQDNRRDNDSHHIHPKLLKDVRAVGQLPGAHVVDEGRVDDVRHGGS